MKNKREGRLNSEFQREIYEILKNRIKDPEMTEMFSILAVETTSDLKHAKVFVSVYSTDEEKKKKTFTAIKNSAKTVRTLLSREMHIRTVPELNFALDESADYGQKIDKILSTITYSGNFDENDEN
ncbi:MAG: 30S ribosome-binding factor RbfA [Clostridia bacterium]|nr:30S ribosome-binding factor RbfA [Clostridia bacterium]